MERPRSPITPLDNHRKFLFKFPVALPDVFPDVSAPGVSATRRYVKQVALEGKVVQGNFLKTSDLTNGGELSFVMAE